MGNHVTVTITGAQGFSSSKSSSPLLLRMPQSSRILAVSAVGFARQMVDRLEPNCQHITEALARSLTLVTALNP
jgi:fumarate hydratase class II